jgi:hypothetical protein
MKKSTTIIIAAATLLAAVSCRHTDIIGDIDAPGTLSLEVEMSSDTKPATKAAMSESELLSSARIKIYKADFSGLVREYVKSQMPATLYLPADSYRIDVEAGEISKESPAPASWEQMSWKGSANVTVNAAASSSVTVTAKVCNTISKLTFDPTVAEAFETGYSCKIGLSTDKAEEQLTYDASKSGMDGYFMAEGFEPSLYWTFTGTLKKNGSKITKSGEIKAVEAGKRYLLGLKYTETDGLLTLSVLVDDSTDTKHDNITFIATSTGIAETSRYDIWAGHFIAMADVDEAEYDKDKVFFEYKQKDEDSWTRIAGTRESEGSFQASISGLTPAAEYEYRLIVTTPEGVEEVITAPSTVRTEAAPMVPNMGFETSSNTESSKYKSLYDPSSSDPTLQKKWWDNGNAGSTLVGSSAVICYPDASEKKEGNQSIHLQSRWVVVKFAAGNLFSGHFGELQGTSGGTVYFGRPFTGRPTAMRLWVKYSSGKVNRVGDAPSEFIKAGDYDKADIKVALGTWDYKKYGGDADSPVCVNTTDKSTFVDYSTDPSTIALGHHIITADGSNSTNVWKQVTIPIEYRNTSKYPTHIIISMASSMYGDYFTGYDDSNLWVDGIELLYE